MRCRTAPRPGIAAAVGIAGGLIAILGALQTAAGGSLTPQEARGKQIYFEGTSPSGGEIEAFIGEDLTALPGFAAACASCHGPDGRGRPEAGVIPSDVTWDYLMKSYGHSHPMGRRHGPFSERTVKDSIVSGLDAAGNPLDPSMPMYVMSHEDLDDLIAYMKRLEGDLDPGLSGESVRIGTIVPKSGRMAPIGRGVAEVLGAFFDGLNAAGGIHNRRLRLVVSSYDNARESPLAAASELAEKGDVFAILSPFVAGADREIGQLAERRQIPLIGPLTVFSPDRYALNDHTFYLLSGLLEQAEALLDFAAEELGLEATRFALVLPEGDAYDEVAAAIRHRGARRGWSTSGREELPASAEQAAAVASRLSRQGAEALFVFGSGDLAPLLDAAAAIGWRPYVFSSGVFAREGIFDLPDLFDGRLFLAYPTLPSDQTGAGIAELSALLAQRGLAIRHRTAQVSSLAAAKVLVEALKGAGRQLSREKLLRSLEGLHELHTGLTPEITYGANRRIGVLGSHVVRVDLESAAFVPLGGWFAAEGSG